MQPINQTQAARTGLAPCAIAVAIATMLQGCGGGGGSGEIIGPSPVDPGPTAPPAVVALKCDDSMKDNFKPDAQTTVLLVKQFKQGDPLILSGQPTAATPTAAKDLCLVKLQVGPGNPGPADAPSTSAGIGIEVWLPSAADYSKRIHNLGGSGWAGGNHLVLTAFGNVGAAATAAAEGAVVGTTDTGHRLGNASFAMNPDGSINKTLWEDNSSRSLYQLAVKSKALAEAFYLERHNYAYWDGCSTGGRQGYAVAQNWPDEYDGYLNGAPATNWTRLTGTQMHFQLVPERDLGGVPLTTAQDSLVNGAAIDACGMVGTQNLGYIPDPSQCRYDPTRDASVLCAGTTSSHGVTGTNTTAACVTPTQAQAANKLWYGQTVDGSAPDPLVDNGFSAYLQGSQLWYGVPRGTRFIFRSAADQVALNFQDPSWGPTSFVNATGTGQDRWRTMTYAQNAESYAQGLALQSSFGNINTDKADLSGVKAAGSKIITYHGLNDHSIPPQGTIHYYTQVANAAGGFHETQKFNRMYLIPAMGHCSGISSRNGTLGPPADANNVPLPKSGQMFQALVDWVEKGIAPGSIVLSSANDSVSRPICPYPQKPVYGGSGPITQASSYTCR